jgi:RimJ/RimL family protein N-acetyltransferase
VTSARVVFLSDGVVGLRRPEPVDAPHYLKMRNDLSLVTSVMGYRKGVSASKIDAWIAAQGDGDLVYTAVDVSAEHRPLGYVKAFRFDDQARTAWVGLSLFGQEDTRKGYGRRMLQLLFDYLRDELAIRKVSLEVLSRNSPALALYAKLGFVEEGRLKRHHFIGGKLEDVLILSLELQAS